MEETVLIVRTENTLQEELCKQCTYRHQIKDNKIYCPFEHCLWDEKYSVDVGNEIKRKLKNRISNKELTARVISPNKLETAVKGG